MKTPSKSAPATTVVHLPVAGDMATLGTNATSPPSLIQSAQGFNNSSKVILPSMIGANSGMTRGTGGIGKGSGMIGTGAGETNSTRGGPGSGMIGTGAGETSGTRGGPGLFGTGGAICISLVDGYFLILFCINFSAFW